VSALSPQLLPLPWLLERACHDPTFLALRLLINGALAHNFGVQTSMAEQASRQLLDDVKK
jgi:hypothetical protein